MISFHIARCPKGGLLCKGSSPQNVLTVSQVLDLLERPKHGMANFEWLTNYLCAGCNRRWVRLMGKSTGMPELRRAVMMRGRK